MSVSLYRKYRPENFGQVLGQDHVVNALQSAIKSGNVSHAYLFAGSRGTGKTSVARIFARELGTSQNDIYEIDVASNNGVDEIRELRDGVSTLPFDSKYKVYILDEVHMLSKQAFNALLKTLEEPPAHVIFILATTELHKVLDTVKSRCQVFEFKKPTTKEIYGMVTWGALQEGYDLEIGAAMTIAQKSEGAFRDAWGLLEKVLQSVKNKRISEVDVESILSKTSNELVSDFIKSLVSKNLEQSIKIINQIKTNNHSISDFLEEVIETCRMVLLFRFVPEFAEIVSVDLNPDTIFQIKNWASEKNIINSEILVEFLKLLDEVKKTNMPEIPVELALIRILGNTAASE